MQQVAGDKLSVPPSASGMREVRLVEFNLHSARYAHESWCPPGLSGPPFGRYTEPHVSRWLLQQLGLQTEMDWEMQEPQKRLWLLDKPSLERLAREFALAMHREWLAQVIDAVRWRALEEKIDPQALRFVVEEVPAGSFHYREPLVSFESSSPEEIGAELTEHGVRALMALLQPTWRAVRLRAELYFDRAKGLGSVPAFEPAEHERALELICGCLIPRRFPEWVWCS